ncbi:MAG TPA: amidohydrolase family protein [Pyrinomonadaceae bacterium]|nr:amidohydrolase family protein [Pyrinomonadaceae bacterium]
MRFTRLVSFLLILSITFSLPSCMSAQRTEKSPAINRLAIRAARMLDVNSGQLITDAVIIVENDRIAAVGSKLSIPQGTKIIDLGDATILPGLIDAHTHITYHFDESGHFGLSGDATPEVTLKYAEENARNTIEAGFTTIRNLGAVQKVDLRLRDAINRGEVVGPRIIASGEPLMAYDIEDASRQVERTALIRSFVRARVSEGVNVIKIFEGIDDRGSPLFSRMDIQVAVEEAKRAGLKVAVHAHEAAAIKAAVEGGCDSIEHGTFLDDEAIKLMVKHHTALVPTLYLPTHYLEHKSQFVFDDSTWEFFERLRSHNLENLRRAKRAGVWIISGSDAVAGVHGHNAREIEWLVKAGLSPLEAIRAATIDAAKLLGMEDRIGEIKEGKLADIIAIKGDPLRDINSLEQVQFVMKNGQVVKTIGATR